MKFIQRESNCMSAVTVVAVIIGLKALLRKWHRIFFNCACSLSDLWTLISVWRRYNMRDSYVRLSVPPRVTLENCNETKCKSTETQNFSIFQQISILTSNVCVWIFRTTFSVIQLEWKTVIITSKVIFLRRIWIWPLPIKRESIFDFERLSA